MKLGTEIGLEPRHIVLDGNPAPPEGAQPPNFCPCLLWPDIYFYRPDALPATPPTASKHWGMVEVGTG